MERVEVELFDRVGNVAVVRLPGRRFPAIVVQGDSLSILATDAQRLAAAVPDSSEVRELADGLAESLTELLAYYGSALTAHGVPLPYNEEKPDDGATSPA